MARGDVDKFWRKCTYVDLGDGICVRIYKTNTRKPHANTIHYAFNDDAAKFAYLDLPEDLTLGSDSGLPVLRRQQKGIS